MRVEVEVLWKHGKQVPRWQLGNLGAARGQLVIREERDQHLARSVRVARLFDITTAPDGSAAALSPLYDVTVLYAHEYTMSLTGFERDESSGSLVAYMQTWIVKILPP